MIFRFPPSLFFNFDFMFGKALRMDLLLEAFSLALAIRKICQQKRFCFSFKDDAAFFFVCWNAKAWIYVGIVVEMEKRAGG